MQYTINYMLYTINYMQYDSSYIRKEMFISRVICQYIVNMLTRKDALEHRKYRLRYRQFSTLKSSKNPQFTFIVNLQLKVINFHIEKKHQSDNSVKSTVVNQTCHFINEKSAESTCTVPLSYKFMHV